MNGSPEPPGIQNFTIGLLQCWWLSRLVKTCTHKNPNARICTFFRWLISEYRLNFNQITLVSTILACFPNSSPTTQSRYFIIQWFQRKQRNIGSWVRPWPSTGQLRRYVEWIFTKNHLSNFLVYNITLSLAPLVFLEPIHLHYVEINLSSGEKKNNSINQFNVFSLFYFLCRRRVLKNDRKNI